MSRPKSGSSSEPVAVNSAATRDSMATLAAADGSVPSVEPQVVGASDTVQVVAPVLTIRRAETQRRVAQFREVLLDELRAGEQEELFGNHTCLYAVGSAGRMEMSSHSDLDLFLVRTGDRSPSRIDEVLLQSSIIRAHRRLDLPEPSRDALFLCIHRSQDLIERLGEPRDDSENTFTARMLLLLESTPVEGSAVYDRVIEGIVRAYWTNLEYHEKDYLPFYLSNDIIRYWRNLLLNYENKTARKQRELDARREGLRDAEFQRAQALLSADKWLRSCKLRFSRCLTCYGTIAWLLASARVAKRVTFEAAVDLTKQTPLQRLRAAGRIEGSPTILSQVAALESRYVEFLAETAIEKSVLLDRLTEAEHRRKFLGSAKKFGDAFFELLQSLGQDNALYRYMVV